MQAHVGLSIRRTGRGVRLTPSCRRGSRRRELPRLKPRAHVPKISLADDWNQRAC